MQIIRFPGKDTWQELSKRPEIDNTLLNRQVAKILADVRKSGDAALKKYAKKFDGISFRKIAVTAKEIEAAGSVVSDDLKKAIDQAYENIYTFHVEQKEQIKYVETQEGIRCWRKSIPIQRVGFYIPGGTAPLFSTVLMLGIPAMIAGCKEKVLCTPPQTDGSVHPAILYTAKKLGVTEIYRCGGAQAIAAMAFGTKVIKKVDKIFGPGNQYVTAAKQLVQNQGVAIDMPAGPSEVCVLADASADPDFVAADLLSQAEHGPDSQVVFLTDNGVLIDKVMVSLEKQLELLERRGVAKKALDNSKIILFESLEDAMTFSNVYAPEHLILSLDDPDFLAEKVTNAGSVFLGHYTPESAGDYASGTNHTLPTNGYARAYSGVSLDSFIKKVTFQRITEEGIKRLGKTIIDMAEAEGLDAHANAVKLRINKK